jgi:hypothetical protein
MAARLRFTLEPDEVALVVTKRWWGGYRAVGAGARLCVLLIDFILSVGAVFLFFQRVPAPNSAAQVTLFAVFLGAMGITTGVSLFLLSRRFLVSNRRVVDCGSIVASTPWMLPLAEIKGIGPLYIDESWGGGGEAGGGPNRLGTLGLRAVHLEPRSGETHLISLDAHRALVRFKLVPEELRGLFPESPRSDDPMPEWHHRN